MSSFQGNTMSMNNEVSSMSSTTAVNTLPDSSTLTSPPQSSKEYSMNDVVAAMIKDLNDLVDKVCAAEAEINHIKGKQNKTRSHQSSSLSSREDEYMEILDGKRKLVEALTVTIDEMDGSPAIPKAKIDCYSKLVATLKKKFDETSQDVTHRVEDLKRTKEYYERLTQEVETFKKLLDEEEDVNDGDEIFKVFQAAKTDLSTLLSILYPENVAEEFATATAALTDAYIKNDKEEDHYVVLPPESLQNPGIVCLIKDFLIVPDPSNPAKYRFNLGE